MYALMATSSTFTRAHVQLRRARTMSPPCITPQPRRNDFRAPFDGERAQDFEPQSPHHKTQPNCNTHKLGI